MKKLNLLLVLLIGLTILSCSADDNNGTDDQTPEETNKLLKKMAFSGNGNYSLTFFYNVDDKLDRIQSLGTGDDFIKQFYYNNGTLDKAEFQDLNAVSDGSIERYIYDNGQLIQRKDYFNNTTLDETFEYSFSSELLNNIKYFGFNETSFSKQSIFEYDSNSNVISRKTDYINNSISDQELTFTYDGKKSPFLNFEPNIVLIDDFFSFKNNPTSQILTDLSNDTVIFEKNYTYTYDNDDYATSRTDGTEIITYEYY
jgi:hypothetical protein